MRTSVASMSDITVTMNTLRGLRDSVKSSIGAPSTLSSLLVELATCNADLGDYLGSLKSSYEQKRGQLYKEHLEAVGSNGKAENLTRADLAKYRGSIQKVEIAHKDITRLVSTVQSRLRSLEAESKSQF